MAHNSPTVTRTVGTSRQPAALTRKEPLKPRNTRNARTPGSGDGATGPVSPRQELRDARDSPAPPPSALPPAPLLGHSSLVIHGALNRTMARTEKENGSSSACTAIRSFSVDTFRRDVQPDLRADCMPVRKDLANGSMSSNQSGEGTFESAFGMKTSSLLQRATA